MAQLNIKDTQTEIREQYFESISGYLLHWLISFEDKKKSIVYTHVIQLSHVIIFVLNGLEHAQINI